jgi:hypothetical protein
MKIAKAINFLALGGFLIDFGVFIKVSLREGFWPGLAVMLICFGVTLIGTATAAQIARTSRRSRLTKGSCDRVARLLAAYPGPVTLKASRTGWVMMALCVVLTAASIAAAADGIPESAFEMGLYALLSAGYSACALLWGELQLDKNGFQATLFRHRQHLWTEVCDFRAGYYSGVQFNVGRPRLLNADRMGARFAPSNDTLSDNYGLKAEELADFMEAWRSAALYGQRDEQPLSPAVSE